MRTARKLCLHGWTQPLQILLYLRQPFSPRKKDHSSRHFLLRLIGRAPGASSGGPCPGACARCTPFSPPPVVPGWRVSSPAWSCAPHPGPSPAPHPCGRNIAFSSGLSGTYNSCRLAAMNLAEKYPDNKIIVIDSLCASMGEGLFVHKAVMMKEEGKSIDEIAAWLEENKLHVVHNFTVDDLFHLYRGGRVSKTAAVVGSMINLKPILHVDNEGHLIPLSKVRGRKKSLIALVDSMEKQIGAWRDKNDIVFISHGDSLEDAQFVAELIKKRLGIENFLINHIGPTIGAHSGPGTIALFYMGDYR